jgi:hypothetical protein
VSLLYVFILAVVGMAILAASRVVRVELGRTPLPEGKAALVLGFAFLFGPPVVLSLLIQPAVPTEPLTGVGLIPPYLLALVGLTTAMALLALGVRRFAPRRSRPRLLLALVGSESDPDEIPFDPPLTTELVEDVGRVEQANSAFPRGLGFPTQIDRPGFRSAWATLDTATRTLEARILGDRRLGLSVASAARASAADARGRLDALRDLAADRGQARPEG